MLGAGELPVQVTELSDQLVDALGDVLPLLVRLEHLTFEGAKLPALLFELAPQPRVLVHLPLVGASEIFDDTFESIEVVGVAIV